MSDKERMTDNEIIKALECCSADNIACKECPFNSKSFCERYVIENAFDFVKRQQDEIKELNAEIDKQYEQAVADIKGNLANGGVSCHWCIEQNKAEAIKEFADSFDDELAKLRDTYFKRGFKDYSLVCEVIHDYLYRTLREMAGDEE